MAMRQAKQRLLNSLSTTDISQLRKLLEACLIGIEKMHSISDAEQFHG
jgi:hypothetical protein